MPLDDLAESARAVLSTDHSALLYGGGQGYEPLRDLIVEKTLRLENLNISPQNLLISNGAAQALGLLATAVLDPGDRVLIDEASWGASFFSGFGAELIPIRWDDEGPLLADVERACRAGPIKFFYTIPTFQNPLGITASLARRRAILELARRFGFLLVEDDAYYELRFAGKSVPSLYQLANGEGVVRTGTFSKILGAGVRLGWAMADPATISLLAAHKYDLGASPFTSRIVVNFMGEHMYRHIQKLQVVYRDKCDALLEVLGANLPQPEFSWSQPEGGFYCWIKLPEGVCALSSERLLAERGVELWAGSWFRPTPGEDGHLRVAYSFASLPQIRAGADIICQVLRQQAK